MLADQLRAVGLGFSHGRRRHSLAAGSTNSFAICSSRATISRSVPGLPDNKAISSTPASRYRFKSSVLIGLVYGDTARWTSERLRPLDSSPENRRQKEFNNCRGKVRRQGDRRSVEWLCRRDGRRLRACWPACNGCQGNGESGCWRAGRRAVCERTGRAGRPEPLLG
jgi:hypothetical protein